MESREKAVPVPSVCAAVCSVLCGTLLLMSAPVHASDSSEPMNFPSAASSPATERCKIGDWDMQAEQRLFQTTPSNVGAAPQAANELAELAPGTLWAVTLLRASDVSLAIAVRRRPPSDASFAGLASLAVPASGRYRITVDGPAWIEVLRDGNALATTRFGSQRACPLFRKSVEFELVAGLSHVLQFSNAESATLRVTIEPSAGANAVRASSQANSPGSSSATCWEFRRSSCSVCPSRSAFTSATNSCSAAVTGPR